MISGLVLCAVANGIATLTLNNPPLNVVTLPLSRAFGEALDAARLDPQVRSVVLTGSGDKAFCAGSDVTEFAGDVPRGWIGPYKLDRQNVVFSLLDDFPKPTVAALNGLVYGGGLEIAVCCDLLVAEERTLLSLPEIKLGVFPSSGGAIRVTRRIGEGRAKEMMFIGEPINARTALAWGLVNRVVPDGESLAAATSLAATLANRPPGALRLCKRIIDLAFDTSEDDGIRQSLIASDEAFSSPERAEGVGAFLAKRPPDFTRR